MIDNLEANRLIFFKGIIEWYIKNGRNFSWRRSDCSAYEILIAEILLRRTMAERVEIVFNKLIKKYPSSLELEKANNYDIQCLIKSLGLRNRDQILINTAKYLNSTSNYNLESLMAIKGIGHYISGAFLVFFKGINIPIIDSNIQRIFNKYFKITSEKEIKKILKKVPNKNVKEFYYGSLDFGAIICKPKPECSICILRSSCLSNLGK